MCTLLGIDVASAVDAVEHAVVSVTELWETACDTTDGAAVDGTDTC